MADFVSASLIGSGIYHRVRNGETRPMMVSVVGMVAGIGRADVAPPNEPHGSSFRMCAAAATAARESSGRAAGVGGVAPTTARRWVASGGPYVHRWWCRGGEAIG